MYFLLFCTWRIVREMSVTFFFLLLLLISNSIIGHLVASGAYRHTNTHTHTLQVCQWIRAKERQTRIAIRFFCIRSPKYWIIPNRNVFHRHIFFSHTLYDGFYYVDSCVLRKSGLLWEEKKTQDDHFIRWYTRFEIEVVVVME